jgi:hypothetical protein
MNMLGLDPEAIEMLVSGFLVEEAFLQLSW